MTQDSTDGDDSGPRTTDSSSGEDALRSLTPSETGRASPVEWPMPAKIFLGILLALFALAVGFWAWGPLAR